MKATIGTKMIFGFALLLIIGVLAAIIALGKVEQSSSFGLQYLLGALSTLCGGFAQWAFSTSSTEPPTPKAAATKDDNSGGDQ